ncbi:MAG TPA: META domain-containing protein [Candidatus Kapabacteria bacterium]|nr:META domain-containing protein [Candidatus Kapabacteria bacterium]
MKRRLFLLGCVLILGAAVQSCRETGVNPWDKPKDDDPNNNTGQLTKEQLAGTHWQFQRFETATTVSLPTEDFIDLRFEGLNRIGGKAICNVYGGEVELQNGSINVSNIISTEAYCGDDKLDQEYIQALNKAQSWTATATELRIKYVPEVSAGGSGGVLVFKRLNGGNDNGLELKLKQLESKQYTLHSFVNGGIEEVPVGAQSCLLMLMPNYNGTGKGIANFLADCNKGYADISFNNDGTAIKFSNISIGPEQCEHKATADRFVEFLRHTDKFEISDYGTTLTIWSSLPSLVESKIVLKVATDIVEPYFIEIQETPSTGVPANTYPMFYLNGLAFDGKYINVKYKYGGQTNDYRVSAYSAFEIGKSDPPLIIVDLVTDGTNNPISSLTEGEVNIGLDALRKRVLIASPGKTKFRVQLRWDGKPIGEVEVIV